MRIDWDQHSWYFWYIFVPKYIPPTVTPVPTIIGTANGPNTPNPSAPTDWQYANVEPACTNPIPAWIPAAVLPAATPDEQNPTAGMIALEVKLTIVATPDPIPVAIAVSLAILVIESLSYVLSFVSIFFLYKLMYNFII